MRRFRAVPAGIAAVVLVSIGLGGCSPGGGSATDVGGGTPSGVPATGAEAAAGTAEPYAVIRAALQPSSDAVALDVYPRKGGTLRVELPSGAVATLTFEAGAVDTRTTLTMTAFSGDGVEGVQLEPAGTWLAVPAHLDFTNTDRTPVIRVDSSADGRLHFATPATDADGAVVLVRLRPVLLLANAPGDLPAATSVADRGVTDPGLGGDPLDGAAATEEGDEAKDPDGESGSDAAKDQAKGRTDALASQCGPAQPQAAAQALEAWRSAGSIGAPPAACAVLRAEVLAEAIVEFPGSPLKPYQEVVRATGTGAAIDQVADIDMPAQREVSGIEQLVSLMATGMEWGVAKLAGKDWPDPNVNRCSLGAIPQGSVRLETVPLPDGKLRVTLTPKHGAYPVDCGEWGVLDMDVTVWDTLGDLLGFGGGRVVVTTTATEHVQHVMSSLKAYEGAKVKHRPDGSVTVREGGLVMNGVLDLDLRYEPAT